MRQQLSSDLWRELMYVRYDQEGLHGVLRRFNHLF